jgi:hypothetical protein
VTHTTASDQRRKTWSRYESVSRVPDIRDRILRHVVADSTGGCWNWSSAKNGKGYSILTVHRQTVLAHRLSLLIFKGPFDPACDVDHLCRNPSCVNPEHLEAVSHLENVRRGESFGRLLPVCRNGHEYPIDAPIRFDSRGRTYRQCRSCDRDRQATRTRHSSRGASRRGTCPNGHEYTTDNTSISTKGQRRCRRCHNERCARARKKASHKALTGS